MDLPWNRGSAGGCSGSREFRATGAVHDGPRSGDLMAARAARPRDRGFTIAPAVPLPDRFHSSHVDAGMTISIFCLPRN